MMRERLDGAQARHLGRAIGAPLTQFLVRLIDMTPEELKAADPNRAARTFPGLDPNRAAEYIRFHQQQAGIKPIEWEPVPVQKPPRQKLQCDSDFGVGDTCPHGCGHARYCDECQRIGRGREEIRRSLEAKK